MKEIYEQILHIIENGEKAVLVTVTEVKGSSPRHSGSKMIVYQDGSIHGTIGGGKIEAQAIKEALAVRQNGSIRKKIYNLTEKDGMLCGGQAEVMFEPIGNEEKLLIFGAGHIGQALAPMAKMIGLQVTILDNREEFATKERFPSIGQILSGEYSDIASQVSFNENTYIVIVTHGHVHDEEVLEYCIRQPFKYIGMIGSRNKSRTVLKHLQDKGIEQELLNQVYTPIGLNIGAETPAEIAISILSELIAVRRKVVTDQVTMKLPEI